MKERHLERISEYHLSREDIIARNHAKWCYYSVLSTLFGGVGFILGFGWALIKKPSVKNTYFYDHFENLTLMFWVSLLVILVTFKTFIEYGLIAVPILLTGVGFIVYRLVTGLSRIKANRPYKFFKKIQISSR